MGRTFFQDALRVSVFALRSGREGQDLGLPLLHVLGKKLEKYGGPKGHHGKKMLFFGFIGLYFLNQKRHEGC